MPSSVLLRLAVFVGKSTVIACCRCFWLKSMPDTSLVSSTQVLIPAASSLLFFCGQYWLYQAEFLARAAPPLVGAAWESSRPSAVPPTELVAQPYLCCGLCFSGAAVAASLGSYIFAGSYLLAGRFGQLRLAAVGIAVSIFANALCGELGGTTAYLAEEEDHQL